MNEEQLSLVKAALAALSQNATLMADIDYAKRCLQDVVQSTQQGVAAELPAGSHYDRMDTAEIFGYDGDHWD